MGKARNGGYKKGLFLVVAATLFVSGFFVVNSALAVGGVTISPASGGENVSIDTTSFGGRTGIFTELSGPSITESIAGDISTGDHTFNLPDGWVFDTGSTVTVIRTSGNILPASQTVTPSSNSFTFNIATPSTAPSSLAFILSSLKIKPTGNIVSTGVITHSGAAINGVVNGSTSFGTLTTIPGAITKLAFTTPPGATVYGSNLSTQPVVKTQDQFGNDSANGSAGKTVALTLTSGSTGTLLGTASLDISSGTASFSGLTVDAIGTKQLTASAVGLTPATSATFEITKKPLTVSGLLAADKSYDGNTDAVVSGTPSLVGVVPGDEGVVSLTGTAVGPFDNANIGSRTVAISGLSLTGTSADNYTLTQPILSANINPLEVTITPTPGQSKVYGSTDPTFLYGRTALIGSDDVTGALSRAAGEDVNTYAYAIGSLTAGSNYHLNLGAGTFEITRRDLTVTAMGVDREYDGTPVATVALSSNKIPGDSLGLTYTGALFSSKIVGNNRQVNVGGISINGPKAGNYNLLNIETQTTANITAKPLTISFTTDVNKTYNGTTQADIHRGDGTLILSGVIAPDDVRITDGSGAATFADKNIGSSKIVTATGFTLSGADKDNYFIGTTNPTTGNIIPRPITVTAATNSKTYDGAISSVATPTITAGTLAAGDTAGFMQAYDNKNAGTGKTLTPSGSVNDGNSGNNYTVTFVNNTTGEITRKLLTATVTVANKVYDGNDSAAITSVALNGVVGGDTINANYSSATANFADAIIGNGKAVTATGINISGADAGNYSYGGTATGIGNILPIPAIVYVDDSWAGTTLGADPDSTGPATAFGYDAFATIQEAIDAVDVGGTVNVATGTYNITSTPGITINKSLTVDGAGINSTIVSGSAKNASVVNGQDALFNVTANNVTIKNLTIDLGDSDSDYDVGIFTPNNGGVNNLTIQNNKLLYAAYGNSIGEQLIHLGGGSGATISGNTMETASGNSTLYVGDGSNSSLTINGNTVAPVSDADGGGTFFNQMGAVTNSTINGNNFTDTGIAVYLGSGSSNTDTVTVSDNTFTSNNGHPAGYGAIAITSEVDGVNTQNITITGNTFTGSQVAAAITIFDSANTSVPNVIGSTISITNNKFGTDNFGDINVGLGVAGTVNAESNYWGTAILSTIDGKISGSVDFDPYYIDSAKTILSSTVPTTVYVDDGYIDGNSGGYYFGYNAFANIQNGIDAVASGGTVNVAAGTYAETVNINKTITLNGESNATTIIQPAANQDGIFITADDAMVRGLKVVTSNNGVAPNIAVRIEGTNNVEINNNAINTTGDRAMGIWVGGSSNGLNPSTNLKIKKNTIIVNGRATGIYAAHSNPAHSGWIIGGSAENANSIILATANPVELYDVTASEVSYNNLTITAASDASNVIWSSELSNIGNLVFRNNTLSGSSGSEVAFVTDFIGAGGATTVSTVSITNNSFDNWGSRALKIGSGVTSVTANDNKFLKAAPSQILLNESGSEVNAERNWWGSATGATIASLITGSVDYRPWRLSGDLALAVDMTIPTVSVSSTASSPTNLSTIPISIHFSETAVDFTADDITVTNGTKGALISGSGSDYTINITPTAPGDVTIKVNANTAWDESGNYNTESNTLTITYDNGIPTLTAVTIASNNANNAALAIVGNTITLAFTASENLTAKPTVTIATHPIDAANVNQIGDAQHWTATYVMTNGDTNGTILFTINFSDIATNPGVQVVATIGGSSVTYDKTAPTTSLVVSPTAPNGTNDWYTTAPTLTLTCADQAGLSGCGPISYKWNGAGDYSTYSGPLTAAEGTHTLHYRSVDNAGNSETALASAVIKVDTTNPTLVLGSLFTGQTLTGGRVYPINWTATDANFGGTPVKLEYSIDDGASTWYAIVASTENDGSYSWSIPTGINSSTAKIKITATDLAGNPTSRESSSAYFTIAYSETPDTTPPVVTVNSPNGGESWQGGSSHIITWTATDDVTPAGSIGIKLEYSTNGSTNWTTIAAGTENDGAYSWTVPNSASTNVLVKVTATDAAANAGSDLSNAVFTITSQPARICTDAGGGQWTCNIALSAGWNLVSLPVIVSNTAINAVLSGISGIDTVDYWNGSGWVIYKPGVTFDLTAMEDGKGYWINMTAPATLVVTGTKSPAAPNHTPTYGVLSGWNLIGFKSTISQLASTYLQTLPASSYTLLNASNENKNSGNMDAGKGYWLWMSGAGSIVTYSEAE